MKKTVEPQSLGLFADGFQLQRRNRLDERRTTND